MKLRQIRLDNWDERDASIILRLMVACNDIMMSYQLDKMTGQTSTRCTEEFVDGTRHYLLRLLAAQIYEALKILPDVKQSTQMCIILNRNGASKRAFDRLLEYKKGGTHEKSWQTLARIRNDSMFHYYSAGKLLVKNLKKRRREGLNISKVVFGEDTAMRFVLADEVTQMVFTYDSLGHHDGEKFDEALKDSVAILNNAQQDFATVAVALVLGDLKDRFC